MSRMPAPNKGHPSGASDSTAIQLPSSTAGGLTLLFQALQDCDSPRTAATMATAPAALPQPVKPVLDTAPPHSHPLPSASVVVPRMTDGVRPRDESDSASSASPVPKKRTRKSVGRPSNCPNPLHGDGCVDGPHCKCPAYAPFCSHAPGGCTSTQNVKWRKFCNACLAGKRNQNKATRRQPAKVALGKPRVRLPGPGRPSACPNPLHAAGCSDGPHCKCPGYGSYCSHGPGGCTSTQNVKWRKFCNCCLAGKRKYGRAMQAAAEEEAAKGVVPGGEIARVIPQPLHAPTMTMAPSEASAVAMLVASARGASVHGKASGGRRVMMPVTRAGEVVMPQPAIAIPTIISPASSRSSPSVSPPIPAAQPCIPAVVEGRRGRTVQPPAAGISKPSLKRSPVL